MPESKLLRPRFVKSQPMTPFSALHDPFFSPLYIQTAAVSAVPEPSTYAALMGVAVMGLAVVWRKKRAA